MDAILLYAVISLLALWSAFWVIRLAVRHGVDDALRKHRALTSAPPADHHVG